MTAPYRVAVYSMYVAVCGNSAVADIIHPRRACAARVTVVVLCVCVSVCVCVSTTILGPRATMRLMSDTNRFSATRAGKIMWRFC